MQDVHISPKKRPGKRKRASSEVDPVERSLLERLEAMKKPKQADEAEILEYTLQPDCEHLPQDSTPLHV